MFKFAGSLRVILIVVENEAKAQLEVLRDLLQSYILYELWNEIYNAIYSNSHSLNGKLQHEYSIFNTQMKLIRGDCLKQRDMHVSFI